MKRETRFLNVDLDLEAPFDLHPLAEGLARRGLFPLHVTRREDGVWLAAFETEEQFPDPGSSIAALLEAVENLDPPLQRRWRDCRVRRLDIGFDCGDEPRALSRQLAPELLARTAAVGASLGITLYPLERPELKPGEERNPRRKPPGQP